ncbi:related to transcription factor TFIIA-L [Rhynchosporium graminicola]|uniref:Transcription initiation factor IIA large subunit n=1 Tax=Rhynchosporium graminicola TaxID=2792576 RepID=A0A1E1L0B9_9HELO|nr:related to transcription factor TFIIA-L [Rhynchosporium commune]
MSNTQVGTVYQQIIQDVIDSSRVDFEEGGVDDHVLEELRAGWQQKLSQLQVAQFPWDPKPEPIPAMVVPPTVPSNANYQTNTPPLPNHDQGPLTLPQLPRQPQIKAEPGLDHGLQHVPHQQYQMPLNLPANATPAQARAAQHLHQNYGSRAAASINAIQAGPNQPQQPQQPQQPMNQQQAQQQQQQRMQQNGQSMNLQQMQHHQQQTMARQNQQMMQGQGQGQGQGQQSQNMQEQVQQQGQGARPAMNQEQYRQMMAQNAAARLQQTTAGQNGVSGAQTDGAGDEDKVDFFGLVKSVNASGEEVLGRVEIDGLIRAKIESMGTSMEGGGLMLPLKQASISSSRRQRKVKKVNSGGAGQMDAQDDDDKDDVKDEELDEDAINSDLDDPDDGLNDEEDDDENMGHIMLCMYDKVQRVKNKWKCVMKDGVLTVNGKEYVFHKASGEYEW